jgi:cell division protein FtsI/penicillin-binding protein 2
VMDPRTGHVLAMANWPFFDPADSAKTEAPQRRNRCVTDPYEPGSIFKPFIFAAALDAGIVRPNDIIDTTSSGVWNYRGRSLHDSHAHGPITVDKILVVSSNIGMGKIGVRMSGRKLHSAVVRFGFAARTGIGLGGESRGLVTPLRKWNPIYSTTSVPMGQEIAVTPIQMTAAFTAFANGGVVSRPTLVADGEPLYQQAISKKWADHTRQVMRRVVTHGTGKNARSDLYQIWGKTGTAQVRNPNGGGYARGMWTSSFVCGAPLKNPRVVVLAVVHKPDPAIGYYGGKVAAPAARKVVEQSLRYMGVRPDIEKTQAMRTRFARAD